jgi:hypothetical protein
MNYPALRTDTASTASEIIHRAQAIRAQLYRPANAVKDTAPPPVPRDFPTVHVIIRRRDIQHDAHVTNWKAWKAAHEAAQAALNGTPCKSYIMARCEALGVSYDDVVGKSRARQVVEARQILMYEIKTKVKPSISFPDLGRLFNRDHTVALHSINKVMAALGDPVSLQRMERKKERTEGYKAAAKARAAG